MINSYAFILIIFGLLSVTNVAFAAFSATDWSYAMPITIPSGQAGYVRATLDEEVYKGSANGKLSDIRVVTTAGQEIPYQLVALDASVRNSYYPSTLLDLSERNGEAMFILDLGKDGLVHDRLNIISPSQNFKRQVSVFASAVLLPHGSDEWRNLTNDGYIYNFSDERAGFNSGSGEVNYPKSTSRYVRIVVHAGAGSTFRVTSANVHSVEQKYAKEDVRTHQAVVSVNAKQQSTEVIVDLGATGVPTHRLMLSIEGGHEDLNFDRRVAIDGSDDGVTWRTLGQGYISQLHTQLFTGSQRTIEYAESNTRHIRAVVFNEDNAPLPLTSTVGLFGVARAIVFEANPQSAYMLYFGNPNASAPRYDIARFFQYIESANLPIATLGVAGINSGYVAPKPPEVPFSERNKNILNGALVLLVAVVSFILISYLKKLKQERPNN